MHVLAQQLFAWVVVLCEESFLRAQVGEALPRLAAQMICQL